MQGARVSGGATPDEVAAALLLLTNPSMTGAVIHVDGGARLV